MDDIQIGKKLGKGRYGVVYIGFFDNKTVAIKKLSKENLKREEINYKKEIEILEKLDSPHIIKLLKYFEDNENIYHVLEFGDTDLFSKLGKITNKLALNWIKEIAKGLKYIHSKKIIHRDIKAENILLIQHKIKIIDFGFAFQFQEDKLYENIIGTTYYISPEMILKRGYDYRIDIWALGILYYELIGGEPPFYEKTEKKKNIFDKILECNIKFDYKFTKNSEKNILKILKYKPEDRSTIDDILEFN